MSNLQQAIAHLSRLNDVELSYISTLAASSIKSTWQGSLLLDLPRELRDEVYHINAARFYKLVRRPVHNRLALTLVNKQVSSEFTKALWGPEVIQGHYLDTLSEPQIWRVMSPELLKYTFCRIYHGEIRRDDSDVHSKAEAIWFAEHITFVTTWSVRVKNLPEFMWDWPQKPAFNGYLELPSSKRWCFDVMVDWEEIAKFGRQPVATVERTEEWLRAAEVRRATHDREWSRTKTWNGSMEEKAWNGSMGPMWQKYYRRIAAYAAPESAS